jgi:hypothetical protein
MHKLPVVATYANVMRFAFGRFFTTLRLTWLPILLLLAAIIGHVAVQLYSMGLRLDTTGAHPPTLAPGDVSMMFASQFALFVLQLIAMSAVAVAIHRVILFGDTKPGVWFNFPFGATELRFLGMGLMFALMVIGVILLIVAPVLFIISQGDIVGFFSAFGDKDQMEALIRSGAFFGLMAAYMAGWIVVLFLMVRLAVWPPSVVATGSLSPAEPWRLTRGNFWNLIGLFILTGATIYAIMIPFGIAFAGYLFANLGDLPARGKEVPPEVVFETMKSVLPVVAVFYFFLIVFVTGTTVAVLSYAYKALKGIDAKEPVPNHGD